MLAGSGGPSEVPTFSITAAPTADPRITRARVSSARWRVSRQTTSDTRPLAREPTTTYQPVPVKTRRSDA